MSGDEAQVRDEDNQQGPAVLQITGDYSPEDIAGFKRRFEDAAAERVAGYGPQTTITPGHRDLTEKQQEQIRLVRTVRKAFVTALHAIGGTTPGSAGPMGSANLTIALRHVEDAEYRAVRHITGGPQD